MSEIFMEDIHGIGLEAVALIEARMKAGGVEMTDEQKDLVYVPICEALEKVAGYPDYRSYN